MTSWNTFFTQPIIQSELEKISQFRKKSLDEDSNLQIYPESENVFKAFTLTPFESVKVVIIGQDCYHGSSNNIPQAQGLCFSVPDNFPLPPSLKNIFKELVDDIGCAIPKSGNLTKWANQGVLLINKSLSVKEKCPNSHKKLWNTFSKELIKFIYNNKDFVIFICWGNDAINTLKGFNYKEHIILTAKHPSPLSANKGGFFGCKHFSKCNEILEKKNISIIDWSLNN
jgi:uracil-DNA glycosylase